MGVHKRVVVILLAVAAGSLCGNGFAAATVAADFQASSQSATPAPATSHKSNPSAHHITVAEEEAPPPELTKAEELIRKQNFVDAELLLRKAVERDAHNYVSWFDLGFTENALGNLDESIAAYRKSVEARPDVFNRTSILVCNWPRRTTRMPSSFFAQRPSSNRPAMPPRDKRGHGSH